MQPIDAKLDNELSAFICGWDAFEKTLGEHEIIDMCLSERVEAKQYADRQEILKDIEFFLSTDELKNHKQISRKLVAHKNFLLAAMGKTIPFVEYFENTMGLKPVLFSEEKITKIRDSLSHILDKMDLSLGSHTTQQLTALEEKFYTDYSADKVPEFMKKTHDAFYKKINSFLNLNADIQVNYDFLPEDSQFFMWISGDGKKYSIQLNKKLLQNQRASKIKILAAHEITAHAIQWSSLRNQIEENGWPKYLGYMTVHEPIQFSAEGLATTIQRIYPEEFDSSPIMQASDMLARLCHCVFNNAAYRLNHGESFEDCLQYALERDILPKESQASKLNYALDDKTLGRGYFQIYGLAQETFMEIAGSHLDKNSFIKSVYQNYMMPEDIMAQSRRPIVEFV